MNRGLALPKPAQKREKAASLEARHHHQERDGKLRDMRQGNPTPRPFGTRDCERRYGICRGRRLSGRGRGCQNSPGEKIDEQALGCGDVVVPCFSIASIRVGPIPDACPEIGQVLRIDAEVSVAAKIQ